jgi:hypothetical protein
MNLTRTLLIAAAGALCWSQATVLAGTVGTAFMYQGQLKEDGAPANGDYDFLFKLFDAEGGPAQVGDEVTVDNWPVSNGLFSVQLDFGGDIFTGDELWLEVAARPGASEDPHTVLTPRQPLTAAPYALYALGGAGGSDGFWAASGDNIYNTNANAVGIGTNDPRMRLHVAGSYYGKGSLQLYAYQGEGESGTASLSTRDFSETSSIDLQFKTQHAGSRRTVMTLASGGAVGIGTTEPQMRLHVAGSYYG